VVRIFAILPLLIGCAVAGAASAAQMDECKACREDLLACTKAHSKDACRTNYEICLRHCRPQVPWK
jgi:hypothetical protein